MVGGRRSVKLLRLGGNLLDATVHIYLAAMDSGLAVLSASTLCNPNVLYDGGAPLAGPFSE